MKQLPCDIHRPLFPYYRYFDLAREGHFGLDLLGDLEAEAVALAVGNLIGLNDHAQLTACLYSVSFFHAGV